MNKKKEMRDVFGAIADPTRRRLIDLLAVGEERPLHELTPHFSMGRTAVSKHLAILKEAGLVQSRKAGRETLYTFNAMPLVEVKDWLAHYERFWHGNLLKLKQLLEEDEQ